MTPVAKKPPGPLIAITIEPKAKADQETLDVSLKEIVREDPSFRVHSERGRGQTILEGMGELHSESVVDRLLCEFKIETNVGKPQVAYKETVCETVEHEAKFVRQVGGRGQYGHVVLRVEPLPPRKGFEFADSTKGGVVPPKYVLAVEKGVRAATEAGMLVGYPVVDVKVTLLDGSYHEVDSSEMAFKIVGSIAFKEAARRASPVILEPVMSVEVVVPGEFLGDVIGNLSARRGKILGIDDSRADVWAIHAHVPLAQMLGYAADLRARTQGRATYTMEFETYVQADPPLDPDGNEPASMALRVA